MTGETSIVEIGAIIGGDESHVLVERLLAMIMAWADRQNLKAEILEKEPASGGGLRSAKLRLPATACAYVSELHQGTHTLVRTPPDDLNRRRHMSVAGIRVSADAATPLPRGLDGWGPERRRYVLDPYKAMNDQQRGRIECDPEIVFGGDFSVLEV
jgi:protein subunit release factor B